MFNDDYEILGTKDFQDEVFEKRANLSSFWAIPAVFQNSSNWYEYEFTLQL